MSKPIASLSLDLDNQWSYMKTHGNPAWSDYPTYLDVVVPRVLEFMAARNLDITVFIVGQDATRPENTEALQSISHAGHEIGNHSHNHEPWLHKYSTEQIRDELHQAHDAIQTVTGVTPVGFRGPGFSLSTDTLDTLSKLGYTYDGSTLPTFIGPLARAYYFRTSTLSQDELKDREALFGHWRDVLRPINPYRWSVGAPGLVEIPVTTIPLLRVPFHFSYLLYLAEYSEKAAELYFATALRICKITGVAPSLLLHPLDFLGPEDADGLEFFPGMVTHHEVKLRRLDAYVDRISRMFDVVPMGRHVESLSSGLRERDPDFQQ